MTFNRFYRRCLFPGIYLSLSFTWILFKIPSAQSLGFLFLASAIIVSLCYWIEHRTEHVTKRILKKDLEPKDQDLFIRLSLTYISIFLLGVICCIIAYFRFHNTNGWLILGLVFVEAWLDLKSNNQVQKKG